MLGGGYDDCLFDRSGYDDGDDGGNLVGDLVGCWPLPEESCVVDVCCFFGQVSAVLSTAAADILRVTGVHSGLRLVGIVIVVEALRQV